MARHILRHAGLLAPAYSRCTCCVVPPKRLSIASKRAPISSKLASAMLTISRICRPSNRICARLHRSRLWATVSRCATRCAKSKSALVRRIAQNAEPSTRMRCWLYVAHDRSSSGNNTASTSQQPADCTGVKSTATYRYMYAHRYVVCATAWINGIFYAYVIRIVRVQRKCTDYTSTTSTKSTVYGIIVSFCTGPLHTTRIAIFVGS